MMSLSIRERTEADTTVLGLTGQLDLASRDELIDALRDALRRGAGRVVVDLSELEFIDSSGIAALVRSLRLADESGVPLAAACGGGQAARVLRASGIDAILPLHAELSAALAAR